GIRDGEPLRLLRAADQCRDDDGDRHLVLREAGRRLALHPGGRRHPGRLEVQLRLPAGVARTDRRTHRQLGARARDPGADRGLLPWLRRPGGPRRRARDDLTGRTSWLVLISRSCAASTWAAPTRCRWPSCVPWRCDSVGTRWPPT